MKQLLIIFLLLTGIAMQAQQPKDSITSIYSVKGLQTLPEYPGGVPELYSLISEKFKPTGVGNMLVSFIVEKDGSVTDITILQGMNKTSDKRLIKVVKKMKRWSPGIQDNKPVRVRYTLPVRVKY